MEVRCIGLDLACFGFQRAKEALGTKNITYCRTPYEAASGSEALVLLTEWDEFKKLDFHKIKKLLKRPLVIDGRNMFEPGDMKKLGVRYVCIGRKQV